ncbi:MAG: hypothetical protein NUW01_13515 [Gemmatimonadaceae bacterium]|nr:hypothetical protein [Gemmatimonadaceae bacterium]
MKTLLSEKLLSMTIDEAYAYAEANDLSGFDQDMALTAAENLALAIQNA